MTLASEMQESTRKFKVTADLADASVGTIEVPLTIENLPSGLTAVATPQKITVKVGKKAKRDGMSLLCQRLTLARLIPSYKSIQYNRVKRKSNGH